MKKYTFKLNNTPKTNNVNNNENYSKIIDNIISANIRKNNPWMEQQKSSTRNINIDIDIHRPKKVYTLDFNDYGDIFDAIKYIYDYKKKKPLYDFKLADGTPVKMFSDEIQIGYDLIPLTSFTREYYDMLSEDTRKHIIDITIDIKRAA